MTGVSFFAVIAGLVPATRVFSINGGVRVDTRDKPGHDVRICCAAKCNRVPTI